MGAENLGTATVEGSDEILHEEEGASGLAGLGRFSTTRGFLYHDDEGREESSGRLQRERRGGFYDLQVRPRRNPVWSDAQGKLSYPNTEKEELRQEARRPWGLCIIPARDRWDRRLSPRRFFCPAPFDRVACRYGRHNVGSPTANNVPVGAEAHLPNPPSFGYSRSRLLAASLFRILCHLANPRERDGTRTGKRS